MPYRKQVSDRDVYDLAIERINVLYDRYDKVCVMFSGGKDSTVCLQLALEVARAREQLPLEVIFWDEEAIPPETIDYVERVRQMPGVYFRWLCVPVKHRNACSKKSPYWNPWAPEDKAKWCRSLPAGAVTKLPGFKRETIPESNGFLHQQSEGQIAAITGIRANESLRRYRVVTKRSYDNWISVDSHSPQVLQAKPIYDWTTEDVWTAPARFGWDYNTTYDTMARAGIPKHVQRVCPPFGEEPLQRLWQYAVCWPELWEKMVQRVPGAATAGRYSCSPLYSFNAKFQSPPPGMTWKEAIRHEVGKWPPEQARLIAKRIEKEIRTHNTNYDNAPIPDVAQTGLSWSFLYTIAVRGDLKNRRTVPHKSLTNLEEEERAAEEDRILGRTD